MHEIKCPNCGEVFTVDESGYAAILSQVRDAEFTKELQEREKQLKLQNEKDAQIAKQNAELIHEKKMNLLNQEIERLNNLLASSEKENELAVNKAVDTVNNQIVQKNMEISALKQKLENIQNNAEKDKQIAINEIKAASADISNRKDLKIAELESKIIEAKKDSLIALENQKQLYETQIKFHKEELENYKQMKAKLSTKMIGESLEQHCQNEFNRLRATGFQSAYFEKDNDAKTGSKGDFIFKDFTPDGLEYISIMFEMKNEADNTASKHKNEDFLKELDKDRNEKKCEYAVLVSLLEADNEFYNTGIVDMSYKYPKMYVIRPQFFIPMITLLRNAALNAVEYKTQLIQERNNNLDITHFEENMETFKAQFGRNYELASRKFKDAIDDIDKTIKALEKTRADLVSSENNLRLANDKAQDLSIKRLTKNAPSVAQKFKDLEK